MNANARIQANPAAYHLLPQGRRWVLTREGSDRPEITAEGRESAMELSRQFMRNRDASLIVHDWPDGDEERPTTRGATPGMKVT